MPGLNFVFRRGTVDETTCSQVDRALDKMRYAPSYAAERKCLGRNLLIGIVSYPGYPIYQRQLGTIYCFMEGIIYGKSREEIDALFDQLGSVLSDEHSDNRSRLKALLFGLDGEFAVLVYDSENEKLIFVNDSLGRITYYCYQDNDSLIIAREPKFIAGLAAALTLSSYGLAEAMMFLFPLGRGTFFREMKKLHPASVISARRDSFDLKFKSYFEWNFSENQIRQDAGKYAEQLLDPFLETSRNRIEKFRDRTNILTLSGGLDSRTVLAGLEKYDVDLNLITFVDERGALLRDLSVAKALARAYGRETRRIDLPGIDIDDMIRLIDMKDGHGTGGIAGTVMKSLDLLLAEYGYGCAFYTGDGGGLILAPRCPKIRLRNGGELTGQILRRNALFSLDEAAAVMRLDRGGFEARVHEHFMAYPETELRDKFGHFSIFEHLYRLSYEGEDRVRFFFWSNTPFYGMPFFYRAMLLSDYNKDNHRLFAEFHKRLDPRIARIKYANWGFPISSPITPFYLAAKNWAIDRPAVSRLIRRGLDIRRVLARGGKIAVISDDAALLQNLARGIIAETPGLDNYLDTKRILEYLRRWSGMLQLYSINNILVYLSNLIRSGNEPGLGE